MRTTTFTLIVRYFNFTLSLSPSSGVITTAGGPITSTVSLTRVSEVSQTVSLLAESVPEGVSVSFSPTGCNPTCSATMSITTSGATRGVYGIDVIGTGVGGGADTATYTLTVCDTPSAPQNLTISSLGYRKRVTLAWQPPSNNGGCSITNYKIYRSTSSPPNSLIATVGNVLTYVDSAVTGAGRYFYAVRAVNLVLESPLSNIVDTIVDDYASCKRILDAGQSHGSDYYYIDVDRYSGPLAPIIVWCDMETEGGGYTYYPVESGIQTYRSTDNNTCKQLGMDIVYPRSKAQWTYMLNRYGSSYFSTIPGVTKPSDGGNYTGCAMRNPAYYGSGCSDWRVPDGGRWWLRDTPYSEPNGDYYANCWLSMYNWDPNDIRFNDGNCSYSTTKYICSTNDKP